MKRQAGLLGRSRSLEQHVHDPATSRWISANHPANPMKKLIVREPGTVATDTRDGADRKDAWLRCLRTADAAHRMAGFLKHTVPTVLRHDLNREDAAGRGGAGASA